jgi:hypothetical protein
MRISVSGTSRSVPVLQGLVSHERVGYQISDARKAHYALILEDSESPPIVIDGADSPLERHAINCISELTRFPILLTRNGGEDNRLRVIIPADAERACETGLFRAILKTCGHGQTKPTLRQRARQPNTWMVLATVVGWLLVVILLVRALAYGQTATPSEISIEDREKAEAALIEAHKATERKLDAQVRSLQAQLDIERYQRQLDSANRDLDKITDTLRTKCNAPASFWDITDDFKWVPCDPAKNSLCKAGQP